MKVVQVVPSLSQATGGLFVSISHLVRYSLADGSEVVVAAPKGKESESELKAWAPAEVRRYERFGPEKFGYSPEMFRGLLDLDPDVVHAHGLWTFSSIAASRWSHRTQQPYMLSAHGMLEPWSLGQSRFRKRAARLLYQDRIVNRAACIRATSPMEIESIRAAGLSCPIALIPNGVSIPPATPGNPAARSRDHRVALFVSRLHRKKGLLNLVEAWKRVRPVDWRLRIVGPDDGGHQLEVQAAISAAGLKDSITMVGPVWGEQRFQQYRDADLFVLPSFSENFAMVVAEALGCGLPVITTRGLPWAELEERGCGWWIEIGVEPLADALKNAFSLSDGERREMGARGKQLIETQYSWPVAASKINEVYRWMLGRSDSPETVFG